MDTSKNIINQADLQMSLLSHCIETMKQSGKPIPRMWYFPDELKCLVTLKLNSSRHHAAGITLMVLLFYGSNRLSSITIDPKDYSFNERMFNGKKYGFITLEPDNNHSVVAKYED